jgi:SPP1 family predicted phage head-tail adaptor
MSAGDFDRLVTLQQKTQTRDANGGFVDTWGTLAEVFASVDDLAGREFWESRATNARTTTRITIRYRDDVTSALRVVVDGVTYEVTEVLQIGRRWRLQLLAYAAV